MISPTAPLCKGATGEAGRRRPRRQGRASAVSARQERGRKPFFSRYFGASVQIMRRP